MTPQTSSLARKVAALGASLAVASGLASAPAVSAQQIPQITWEDCPDRVDITSAQCGRIDVPMYYSDPEGAQISVGFVKVPAAGPGAAKGTLFGNPGGPSGDAYSFFGNTAFRWPEELRSQWDLVAVQPRGLPGSTPVDCTTLAPGYDEVALLTREGAFVRDSCEIGTPGYTASLTTDNTANDWEQVRRALGEERISIFGVSYGTYLGSVYASRYPQHTDRVVLDSAMQPSLAWNGIMATQEQGYIDALHDFLSWTAANNDTYGLGDTPLEVYQSWSNRIVAETGTNPTVAPPPARIGDIPPALTSSGQLGIDTINALAPTGVTLQGLATQILHPGANQANSSLLVLTRATLPQPNTWPDLAAATAGQIPVPDLGAQVADPEAAEQAVTAANMQRLIMCNENSVPANYADIPRLLWANFVTGDVFTSPTYFSSGMACSGTTPVSGPQPLDGSGLEHRPLMLQGTRDPQTPYIHHGELASAMNAHVVTVDGPGHGQTLWSQNPEVTSILLDYLNTGNTTATSAPGYIPAPAQAETAPVPTP
ncbi:alpha/beta fold hydrolase [Corynebacterium pacaense]|uniref:alpha/beta fold hydrolase n=1 Tax=Corynebacterium pacaense TaxID=1816684 RepID=UPI0009B9B528|nr:alpha/beta fold hydrolase [Corynebacterium pacaense]